MGSSSAAAQNCEARSNTANSSTESFIYKLHCSWHVHCRKQRAIHHRSTPLSPQNNHKEENFAELKQRKQDELMQHWTSCLQHRSKPQTSQPSETPESSESSDSLQTELSVFDETSRENRFELQRESTERLQTAIIDVTHLLKMQQQRYLSSALQLCSAIQSRDESSSNPAIQEVRTNE